MSACSLRGSSHHLPSPCRCQEYSGPLHYLNEQERAVLKFWSTMFDTRDWSGTLRLQFLELVEAVPFEECVGVRCEGHLCQPHSMFFQITSPCGQQCMNQVVEQHAGPSGGFSGRRVLDLCGEWRERYHVATQLPVLALQVPTPFAMLLSYHKWTSFAFPCFHDVAGGASFSRQVGVHLVQHLLSLNRRPHRARAVVDGGVVANQGPPEVPDAGAADVGRFQEVADAIRRWAPQLLQSGAVGRDVLERHVVWLQDWGNCWGLPGSDGRFRVINHQKR